MALPGESGDRAPAVDTAVMEVLFGTGPDPVETPSPSPAIPTTRKRAAEDATASAPTPPDGGPEARRRHGAPRWKKYGARALAAAAFTVLGGLAAGAVLPEPTAGPQSADIPDAPPEQASSEAPQGHAAAPPRASRPPEREARHPARGTDRDRDSKVIRPPRATVTQPESPTPPAPPAVTAPPSGKPTPAPRPPSGRPSPSPTPTAPSTSAPAPTPSPSPSGSTGTPPTAGPTPSTTVRSLADALRGGTGLLLPGR
ncbi:hypothetical protein HW130_13970 [Streptomyces sp. PKU-EA00015]|uniref:hypothetical protein n=1 Tax=Streptomyces sp. PKU-EA00015 TaxID=2748326 RepID=UPI0015A3844D|nr:hypothetical protein [Streptomyces sp. PKU-EA00015]NWF27365.1 hypothetical protein [Streptomyces sp. PKU-EA00015]